MELPRLPENKDEDLVEKALRKITEVSQYPVKVIESFWKLLEFARLTLSQSTELGDPWVCTHFKDVHGT